MKKFTFAIVVFVVFALLALIASATFTYDTSKLNVSEYQILTSTAVVFNWTVNSTFVGASSSSTFNCTVYNLSGIGNTGNYTPLAGVTEINTTNNQTFKNITVTLPEGRHYWYLNCTQRTGASNTSVVTSTRAFDVDLDYYTLSFGANQLINFTLDTGHITAAGNITGKYINGTMVGSINTLSDVLIGGGFDAGGITLTTGGSGFFDDSILLRGNLTLVQDATVNGSMNPEFDNTFDLGNSTKRWRGLAVSGLANLSDNLTVNGSVGIGLSEPTAKLEVFDAVMPRFRLTQTKNSVFAEINVTPDSGKLNIMSAGGTDPDIVLEAGTGGEIEFKASSAGFSFNASVTFNGGGVAQSLSGINEISAEALSGADDPSYTFTGDADTGMRTPAANILAFSAGGIEQMRMLATNRTSIGGGTPTNTLTVFGSINATTNLSLGSGTASQNITLFSPDGTRYSCGVQDGGAFKCS